MTTPALPDVSKPPGARLVGDWEAAGPQQHRIVCGENRQITHHNLTVHNSAVQWADGSIDDGRIAGPHIYVYDLHENSPLNSDQARELASALLEAATQVDEWVHS